MDTLEKLAAMIVDEIMSAPESVRSDMALQVASRFVEFSGYELARSGTVKSSTRLFLLANEIERLRREDRDLSVDTATVLPFVPRQETRAVTA
jgi:hypothetical protein